MIRAQPPGALRWSLVLGLLALALALLGVVPGVTSGLVVGVALGALSNAFFFWRLRQAEGMPVGRGTRFLRFGTLTRFALVIAVVWLLQSRWPAVNMVAVLTGFFAAWAVFALAAVRSRGRRG